MTDDAREQAIVHAEDRLDFFHWSEVRDHPFEAAPVLKKTPRPDISAQTEKEGRRVKMKDMSSKKHHSSTSSVLELKNPAKTQGILASKRKTPK